MVTLARHWFVAFLAEVFAVIFFCYTSSSNSTMGSRYVPFKWILSCMSRLRHSSSITFSQRMTKKRLSYELTKSMQRRFFAIELNSAVSLNLMWSLCYSSSMLLFIF